MPQRAEGRVEIVPQPTAEEREAILAALAGVPADRHSARGAWGRPLLDDEAEDAGRYATARRRKSDGAPRA